MPRQRTGTIWRHDDHWDLRVTLNDGTRSPVVHLKPSTSEARAKEILAAMNEQAKAGKLLVIRRGGAGETVTEWFERWFKERAARGRTSTPKDRGRFLKWVAPRIGDLTIDSITEEDLEGLVEHLDTAAQRHAEAEQAGQRPTLRNSLSWKSACNVWALVKKGFADAHKSKTKTLRVLKSNPAADVPGPDNGATKARTFVTPTRFLAFASDTSVPLAWRRTVTLAIYTYERASELRGVRWADVHEDEGYMIVHRTLSAEGQEGTTKTEQPRYVPLEPTLVPLLRAMRGASDAQAFKLPDDKHMARGLRRWFARAGLDAGDLQKTQTRAALTWHDLRATGITWRAVRGDDPLKIMESAGHEDFKTTQKYIRQAHALKGFGEVFPPLPASLVSSAESSAPVSEVRTGAANRLRKLVGEVGFETPTLARYAVNAPGLSGGAWRDAGRKSAKSRRADDSLTIPTGLGVEAALYDWLALAELQDAPTATECQA